jgi:Leucine-rich repeat (LRR) protein
MANSTEPTAEELPLINEIKLEGFSYSSDESGWGYNSANDAALNKIGRLKTVAYLDLLSACDDGRVTNEGLSYLAKNRSLAILKLGGSISDAGILHLRGLTQLARLQVNKGEFDENEVTDIAMECISKLVNLRELWLTFTKISPSGFNLISNLKNLSVLILGSNEGVNDEIASRLAGLSQLTYLDLSGTQITEKTILTLAPLTRLEKLTLGYTKLSDQAIPVLSTFTKLELLELSGAGISEKGIAKLKQALPKTNII